MRLHELKDQSGGFYLFILVHVFEITFKHLL